MLIHVHSVYLDDSCINLMLLQLELQYTGKYFHETSSI